MKITLPSEKTITLKNKSITASEVTVVKVVDIPEKKIVAAFIKDLGRVRVKALCGKNYNSPQWTDESLAAALAEQLSQ